MKGEVADLIKSVGHRTTAYHAAWAILETRFGGKKRLERIVYDCIRNFKMVKTSKVLADFDSGLRSAMARLMELDIEANNPPTYNMIASKLSETYLREYFNFLQKEKKEDVESLQEFIEQKAKENAFVEETIKGASSVSSGARRPYAYAHHGSSQKEDKCAACGSPEHAIWRCTKFRGHNIHEKTQVIKKGGLCFKCLRSGHVADKCEMKMRNCGIDGCTRKHNKLLHSPEEPKEENERISKTNHATGRKMKYTLRVVPVLVIAHKEKTKVIKYALLDDGSDQSFVTERLANEMGLQGKRKRKKVSTLQWPPQEYSATSTAQQEVRKEYQDNMVMFLESQGVSGKKIREKDNQEEEDTEHVFCVKEEKHQDKLKKSQWRLNPTRLSSWKRLVRVQAWVKRYLHNLRENEGNKLKGELSPAEVREAEVDIISRTQMTAFCEEYKKILQGEPRKGGKTKLAELNPKVNAEGILRMDRRLSKEEDLPWETRNPTILPKQNHVTDLIIAEAHEESNHGAGCNQLLATLRRKYWILASRDQIKSILHRRMVCRKKGELGRLNGSAGLQTPRIDHCIHKYHSNTKKMSHFLHKLHDGCHPRGLIVDETIDCIKRAVCANVNNGKHW